MARIRNVFEYDVIPFNTVDLNSGPVLMIAETDDGQHIVLMGAGVEDLNESDHHRLVAERYDTFRDYLITAFQMEETEDGELATDYGLPLAELIKNLDAGHDNILMGGGLLQVSELDGAYVSPEAMFRTFSSYLD
jgi:ornithine cyclodeaminase/alanine dehydrogenase-like protein (mu-crystallin family)